jgi:hypothetical protein
MILSAVRNQVLYIVAGNLACVLLYILFHYNWLLINVSLAACVRALRSAELIVFSASALRPADRVGAALLDRPVPDQKGHRLVPLSRRRRQDERARRDRRNLAEQAPLAHHRLREQTCFFALRLIDIVPCFERHIHFR